MKQTVGIIGGGNMGAAILKSLNRSYNVCVCEADKKRSAFLKRTLKASVVSLRDLLRRSRVIILAVKPQGMDEVLRAMAKDISDKHLVISIAAGITIAYIEKRLKKGAKVIRTMPNLPAQIGEGMTAIAGGKYASKKEVSCAVKILNHIGQTVIVKEDELDAVTAVSGSGPAYVFHFIEMLTAAAEQLGLDKKTSKVLVRQTLLGSVHLFDQMNEEAAVLREKVTSKGGTTQAALHVLYQKNVAAVYTEALKAAKARAKQLAKR